MMAISRLHPPPVEALYYTAHADVPVEGDITLDTSRVPRSSKVFEVFESKPTPAEVWADAVKELGLPIHGIKAHARLVDDAIQDRVVHPPRPDDVYCKHWHPGVAALAVPQLRDAWRMADYLMMDAKPLAEDAAQRVMRGFVADVDALGLPDEHRRLVVGLLMPPPKYWYGRPYSAREMQLARGEVVPQTAEEMAVAARWGQLMTIQQAKSAGCRWVANTCAYAAEAGHLEVLQWARSHGCPWDDLTCSAAARRGHLAVLQWARSQGCPWDEWTCSAAAEGGHLAVLQWARSQGCLWDGRTCTEAAQRGHLAVLQWARSQGCRWDEFTCSAAARGGHLAVLQWARSQGCPWDGRTCSAAAKDGHLAVLQWARSQSCPWNEHTWNLTHPDQVEIREWLRANGCPGADW